MIGGKNIRSVVLIFSMAWAPCVAQAQQAATGGSDADTKVVNLINDAAANTASFEFDYGVPSSPALSLAGLSTTKVTTSTSLQSLLLSLPAAIGSGAPNQSVALDI